MGVLTMARLSSLLALSWGVSLFVGTMGTLFGVVFKGNYRNTLHRGSLQPQSETAAAAFVNIVCLTILIPV